MLNAWDNFQPILSDDPFLTAEEKQSLVESGTVFTVLAVEERDTAYGPRYFLRLLVNGQRRTLTLGKAFWRESLIDFLRVHAPIDAVLKKTERGAYYLAKP